MISLSKILSRLVAGTASSGTDVDRPKHWRAGKELSGMYTLELAGQPTGEGVYLEGGVVQREGVNFPTAEVSFETGQPTYLDVVTIDSETGLFVAVYADAGNSNKGTAIVGQKKKGDSAESYGTAVVFNDAATTDISICKLSSSTVAVSYVDDGGDDYLAAIIGTVTESTKVIAFGTEKLLVEAAITKTEGTGICQPRDGVIAVAYGLDADGIGEVIAALYSSTTIADPGTAVDFTVDTDNGGNVDCCSHTNGGITVVYQAGDTANDPLTMNIGTVSAAGVVAFGGSEEALNAAAATSITCKTWAPGVVGVSWIDDNDAHFIVGTIATTVYTQGSELAVDAGTCLTPHFDILDDTNVIYVYENDALATPADPLQALKITRDGTTLTAGNIDLGTEASTSTTVVTALDSDCFVTLYNDVGATNVGNSKFGEVVDDILDVRSSTASAAWRALLIWSPEYIQIDTGY